MFCGNCGNKIEKEATFCGACGFKVSSNQNNDALNTEVSSTTAITKNYSDEQIQQMRRKIIKNGHELEDSDGSLKPSDFKSAIILIFIGIAIIIYGNIRNGSTFLATNYIRIVNDYSYVIGAGWFFFVIGIVAFLVILFLGIKEQKQANDLREENNRLLNIIIELSNAGNMQAKYESGLFYRYGYLLEEDLEKAFNLFSAASNANIALAQYEVAIMYEKGIYIDKDEVKALNWYKKCIQTFECTDKFIPNAYNKVGEFYRGGKAGLPVDYIRAFKYFEKATEHDISNAKYGFYNLGLAYQNGQGCEKDLNKANIYLDKAYDYGVDNAQDSIFENTGGKY